MLRRFETRGRQRRLILRIEAKFRRFWPPVKIRGGGRFAKFFRVTFWRHLGPNHWYTFDGAPLRRLAATRVRGKKNLKKSSEVKYKGLSDYCRSGLNKRLPSWKPCTACGLIKSKPGTECTERRVKCLSLLPSSGSMLQFSVTFPTHCRVIQHLKCRSAQQKYDTLALRCTAVMQTIARVFAQQ